MADPVVSSNFAGVTVPAEVVQFIANAAVTGAPFARSLTLLPTGRGSVAFPTVAPEGFDWVAEAQPLPEVDLNDTGPTIAVAKLAGLLGLGNELIDDNVLPISSLLGQAVRQSMGPKLDDGLLRGEGPPEPAGILDSIPATTPGADLRASAITAWGELVDAGADPERVVCFANGKTVAAELGRTSETENIPIHPDGDAAMIGPNIKLVAVPSLGDDEQIVADASAVYLIQRSDFTVEVSAHALFGSDQAAMRIKGRFAVNCPTVDKSMRRIADDVS